MKKKNKYYAVRKGRVPGIYLSWDDCRKQVDGFSNSEFKSFSTRSEASQYLNLGKKSNTIISKKTKNTTNNSIASPITKITKSPKLTTSQETVLKVLETDSEKRLFVTGEAGTGKSFLMNEYVNRARKKGKKIILAAPTGIAAINIGGSTLHSIFKIPIRPILQTDINKIKKDKNSVLNKADILVIDEISMVRADVFSFIIKTVQKNNPNIKIVLVGDFFQLPPVITKEDKKVLGENFVPYAFMSPFWKNENFKTLNLTTGIRQSDANFFSALSKIRIGDASAIDWICSNSLSVPLENGIHICGTNNKASKINDTKLKNLKSPIFTCNAIINGNVKISELPCDNVLNLKTGCRVLSLINDSQKLYQNGSLGTVLACNANEISVKWDSGAVSKITKHEWEKKVYKIKDNKLVTEVIGTVLQFPLKVAYAITIHKSQGQTFEQVNLSPNCFESGQLYVALSRCTNVENLYIDGAITSSDLITSPQVKTFYDLKG